MPSLDLWYRWSWTPCPTFSAPLVLVDVDTLRISYFPGPSRACQTVRQVEKWEIAIPRHGERE